MVAVVAVIAAVAVTIALWPQANDTKKEEDEHKTPSVESLTAQLCDTDWWCETNGVYIYGTGFAEASDFTLASYSYDRFDPLAEDTEDLPEYEEDEYFEEDIPEDVTDEEVVCWIVYCQTFSENGTHSMTEYSSPMISNSAGVENKKDRVWDEEEGSKDTETGSYSIDKNHCLTIQTEYSKQSYRWDDKKAGDSWYLSDGELRIGEDTYTTEKPSYIPTLKKKKKIIVSHLPN